MNSNLKRIGLLIPLLLPIVAATGCTGSEVLSSGNGEFEIRLEVVTTDSRFDRALFTINSMLFEPTDPEVAAALGPRPYNFLRGPAQVSFRNPFPQPPSISVAEGEYRLTRMTVSTIKFEDLDPFVDPETCTDFVRVFQPASTFDLLDFGGVVEIYAAGAERKTLTVTIDEEAFFDAVLAAARCNPSCACPGQVPVNPSCTCSITSYNATTFRNLSATFLSFE